MSRSPFYIVLFFCLLAVVPCSRSQSDLTLSDYAFACETNPNKVEQSWKSGANAFLVQLKKTEKGYLVLDATGGKPLGDVLQQFQQNLSSSPTAPIALVIQGQYEEAEITKLLESTFPGQLYVSENNQPPELYQLVQRGTRVIVVFDDQLTNTSINRIRRYKKYENRFSSDPLGKLIVFDDSSSTKQELLVSCLELWKQSGMPPNFIASQELPHSEVRKVADSLNQLRRFRGIVYYQEELLNEINWYNSPGTITPAKFSFPLTAKEQILSPYKNGFRISPGEVIHHPMMEDDPRVFTAYDIPINDKLIYNFSFDNGAANSLDMEWENSIVKDISFKEDADRGYVLHLSKPNSFIDYSKENLLNFGTPISISVWVKADSIADYMGIIGFGAAFSFKLMGGKPDFTTATIKDHVIPQALSKNTWHHLGVIFNPGATVEFYLDGEKSGEVITSEIKPSSQSLVVGNNIWGEQFYGSLDDLKIWDRGLSAKEVAVLFQENTNDETSSYSLVMISAACILVSMLFFFLRVKWMATAAKRQKRAKTLSGSEFSQQENRLQLFGHFNIKTKETGEVSSRFSPLMRQILSFMVLKTEETKNGISTNKLTETFWPGVEKDKAKENRGTNIKKLRKALNDVEGLKVVFEDKKWYIETREDFVIDILVYGSIKEALTSGLYSAHVPEQELSAFLALLKHGNILQNTHAEWADHFKNKISSEVDTLLTDIYHNHQDALESDVKIRLAQTILLFDSLNEDALKILIRELVAAGKHGQAQSAYETFAKNYQALYAEPFCVEYQEFAEAGE